jgi:exodeoxyribonuclease VII large subunit
MVRELVGRLYDPRRGIIERRQRLDDTTQRLTLSMLRRLETCRNLAETYWSRLRPEYLRKRLTAAAEQRETLLTRLAGAIDKTMRDRRAEAENLAARLEALSPLAVLSRGYSITFRGDGDEVITDSDEVETGSKVRVRLHRGELQCRVTEKTAPSDPDGYRDET